MRRRRTTSRNSIRSPSHAASSGRMRRMAKTYEGGEQLAEVVRSGFVEGLHRGSAVVLGPAGQVVAAAGDVTAPIFPRSSNKPMQAVGMVRAGLRLVDPGDLALAPASPFG